ncbi:MAG: glycosyltransferase family 4 protein [Caulobacteraceae bacterium]
MPISVSVTQTLPLVARKLPWRWARPFAAASLVGRFGAALDKADPQRTIAYFWPDPPKALVERAKSRGVQAVREMTNCTRAAAKVILDGAYQTLGIAPDHGISEESCELERRELAAYDAIFASPQVAPTLRAVGVAEERILATSYGWSPTRFSVSEPAPRAECFTALFVGTVCVGKGVPWLLEAWRKSGVEGELILAGAVRKEMRPWIAACRDNKSIRLLGYVADLGALYRRAHCFVFPSLVEGGPQVAYEAAGCGLPIITTPMGAGAIVKDGVNGIIVPPIDSDALAAAIAKLGASGELREQLGERARSDASRFTYEVIGRERAKTLVSLLETQGSPRDQAAEGT